MKDSINNLSNIKKILFLAAIFIVSVIIFTVFPPQSMDWRLVFYKVSKIPLQPYSELFFINPPWTALILYPFHYFPERISAAINCSLNFMAIGLIIIQRKGGKISLLLTLTSFPFLSLLVRGNIEWMPALGFILQNQWGIPFLLAKPQSGILAAWAWISSVKQAAILFLSALITASISFIVWGNWISKIGTNAQKIGVSNWNISPFPWAIPIGLGLIFYMLKYKPANQELLGTLATLCLVPYFAPYSLTILFALTSVCYRRIAAIFWVLLWLYPIILQWETFIHLLNL
jgi:hypothetical protein